ncbi:G1 family endopeptidase [Actinoallomurus purpureus]|uniref:G1 family glutamic endopeptidase n=1 Tax=Actinoallomurus purpureus TaxID=478114 RepID=UPI002092F240|nr:G1 family glutamic endopeptidase [Actinoallomurus purpureus]MCO6009228.1 G1 family endopeptidase [Actinoallomurus purpureus]
MEGVQHLPSQPLTTSTAKAGVSYGHNWSGGLVQKTSNEPSFTAAHVTWVEPKFTASCAGKSGYSIWSGIGGYNTGARKKWGLLQAGVDNFGGKGPNQDYVFWEALNQSKSATFGEMKVSNMKVTAGDKTTATTYYNTADKTVAFQINNLTRKKVVTLGPWIKLKKNPGWYHKVSGYYDGLYAEAVAERPTYDKKYVNLRKPVTGSSIFTAAAFSNSNDGGDFPGYQYKGWTKLIMNNDNSIPLSTPAKFPESKKAKSTGWTNSWKRCS